jgi:iron complex transport system permease protein
VKKNGVAHKKTIVVIMIVALFITGIFSLTQGSVKIPVSNIVKVIMMEMGYGVDDTIKPAHIFIVTNVRLPRIIISSIVGGILAIIGVAFQAIFKNPMADPYVMGISSGAAFGATLGIVFGWGVNFAGLNMISGMAFVGAVSTVFIVYNMAKFGAKVSTTGILLAGIVMNAFLSSWISLIMILYHNDIDKIVTWTMGSFNAASWDQVRMIILPAILGILFLISQTNALNALVLGEDEAQNLGVDVQGLKKRTLIIASFLAAFAVSVSGIIGFVGLIIPHLFRMIFGANHKVLIPTAFIGGALFLMGCDTLARSIVPNMEIPVGIITSIFGGPFFFYLLHKNKQKMA